MTDATSHGPSHVYGASGSSSCRATVELELRLGPCEVATPTLCSRYTLVRKCHVYGASGSSYGSREGQRFELRTPRSVLGTPRSALGTPHSALQLCGRGRKCAALIIGSAMAALPACAPEKADVDLVSKRSMDVYAYSINVLWMCIIGWSHSRSLR